jgi:hypothetical protein
MDNRTKLHWFFVFLPINCLHHERFKPELPIAQRTAQTYDPSTP